MRPGIVPQAPINAAARAATMCLNAGPKTDVPPFSGGTAKMQAGQPSLFFDMK